MTHMNPTTLYRGLCMTDAEDTPSTHRSYSRPVKFAEPLMAQDIIPPSPAETTRRVLTALATEHALDAIADAAGLPIHTANNELHRLLDHGLVVWEFGRESTWRLR